MTEPSLCPKCQKNEADYGHTCPFVEEMKMNDDNPFVCDCCHECQVNCAEEV